MELAQELQHYPNTGRFLMGRLRYDMSRGEKDQLERLLERVGTLDHGEILIAKDQKCDYSTILIQGFMLRTIEENDRRYAVSFHVPGDFVDLHCFALKKLDHNVQAVGQIKIGQVSHQSIFKVMQEAPHLARLFWFQTLLDAALHRQKIVKLEQLTVPRRIAHLFAETWRRLDMVGLAFADGFETPFTQADIADMCGATPIHTNRAIAELRKRKLADFQRGKVRIADRDALEAYANFDAQYLYGEGDLSLRRSEDQGKRSGCVEPN